MIRISGLPGGSGGEPANVAWWPIREQTKNDRAGVGDLLHSQVRSNHECFEQRLVAEMPQVQEIHPDNQDRGRPLTKGPERILLHNFGPRTIHYQGVEVRPGMTINTLRAEVDRHKAMIDDELLGIEPPIKKGRGWIRRLIGRIWRGRS